MKYGTNSSQCANWGSGRKSEGGGLQIPLGYLQPGKEIITECKLSDALSCHRRWMEFVVMSEYKPSVVPVVRKQSKPEHAQVIVDV